MCGVVPYFHLDIDEEDSLSERFAHREKKGLLDIAVIRLPRISNFTDLMPLESMEEVSVRYVTCVQEFGVPDAVILPGSKNTMEDLKWLRQCGAGRENPSSCSRRKNGLWNLRRLSDDGRTSADPEGVEAGGELKGMGLLPIRHLFAGEKTDRVQGRFEGLSGSLSSLSQVPLEGYEIHMGVTAYTQEPCPLVQIREETGEKRTRYDGARKNNCYGCYVHGIFDHASTAAGFVSALLKEKGYDAGQIELQDGIPIRRHSTINWQTLYGRVWI